MKNIIHVAAENILDVSTWDTLLADDVCERLRRYFDKWPPTARIYHNSVSNLTDVTPYDEGSLEHLQTLEGTFYVLVYPEGFITVAVWICIALAALSIGLEFLLRPHFPSQHQQEQSSNNLPADRQNHHTRCYLFCGRNLSAARGAICAALRYVEYVYPRLLPG